METSPQILDIYQEKHFQISNFKKGRKSENHRKNILGNVGI